MVTHLEKMLKLQPKNHIYYNISIKPEYWFRKNNLLMLMFFVLKNDKGAIGSPHCPRWNILEGPF